MPVSRQDQTDQGGKRDKGSGKTPPKARAGKTPRNSVEKKDSVKGAKKRSFFNVPGRRLLFIEGPLGGAHRRPANYACRDRF